MQHPEPLVERAHRRARLRARGVPRGRLLRLRLRLRLAPAHDGVGHRPQDRAVDPAGEQEDGDEELRGAGAVGEEGGGAAGTRVGEGHGEGEGGLQGEVDGEGVGLEGGEVGAGEDAEGDDAGDEGVVDVGPEEGAVAGEGLVWYREVDRVSRGEGWEGETNLRRWYGVGDSRTSILMDS